MTTVTTVTSVTTVTFVFQCTLVAGSECKDAHPTIHVDFKIMQLAVSGLKVNRLDMFQVYNDKLSLAPPQSYFDMLYCNSRSGIKYIMRSGNSPQNLENSLVLVEC